MSDTKKTFGSLIVLAVGTFLLGMAEYGMEGILPYISHDLGITIPEAGHAISVYALGVCTGATLLIAFHRLSPKKIIFGLVGLIFLGSVLSVTAQNFWWLMAARFISGLPLAAEMSYAWPALVGFPFVLAGSLLLFLFHKRFENG